MCRAHAVDLDERFKAEEPDGAEVMPRYQWDEFTEVEKGVIRQAVKVATIRV